MTARRRVVYGEEQDFFERDVRGNDRQGDVVGELAPLGEGDEAEDTWPAAVELDEALVLGVCVADGRAGIGARVVVPRIATGPGGGRAGGPISVVASGDGGGMVLDEEGAAVVADDGRSGVSVR